METIDQVKKLESDPIIINLDEQAFLDAGASKGASFVFNNKLELIFSGALLDKSTFVTLTNEEILNINSQVADLELNCTNIESDIENTKQKIKTNDIKIEEFKFKLENYTTGKLNNNSMGSTIELFNLPKFLISTFFLLMLSVFIFLFYVAVVYKAIIMHESEIANQFSTGSFGVNVLPHGQEVWNAIATNAMVVFAPFVFFGFGYAVHSLVEQQNKIKYIWIALILTITFVLDYFLAERIHFKMNSALEIMGQEPNSKFSDILIVLILGFVVYVIWSVIFHSWMKELDKRNIPTIISKLIHKLEKQNRDLNQFIHEKNKSLATLKQEIKQKLAKLDNKYVSMSTIIKSLSIYTHGWYKFIAMLGDPLKSQLHSECDMVLKKFKQTKGLTNFKIELESH